MPNYEIYPTAGDVSDIIANTGITPPGGLDYEAAITAAIAEWEDQTGWYPFLAGPPETRHFDPPRLGPSAGRTYGGQGGKVLDLHAGLLDLPDDGLRIGVVPNTSAEVGIGEGLVDSTGSAGVVLTRNIQYYLRPNNADKMGLPWTEIYFLSPTYGVPKSIQITNGVWGYCRKLPADVWRAIVRGAFAELGSELSLFISGGLLEVRRGDEQKRFGGPGNVAPLAAQIQDARKTFRAACARYMRVTV